MSETECFDTKNYVAILTPDRDSDKAFLIFIYFLHQQWPLNKQI